MDSHRSRISPPITIVHNDIYIQIHSSRRISPFLLQSSQSKIFTISKCTPSTGASRRQDNGASIRSASASRYIKVKINPPFPTSHDRHRWSSRFWKNNPCSRGYQKNQLPYQVRNSCQCSNGWIPLLQERVGQNGKPHQRPRSSRCSLDFRRSILRRLLEYTKKQTKPKAAIIIDNKRCHESTIV